MGANYFIRAAFIALTGFTTAAYAGVANHLVISEMAVKGGQYVSGSETPEYVELYNPTGAPIADLSNYFITDWSRYWEYPDYVRRGTLPDEGVGDFVSQFPSDTPALPAGAVITVCGSAKQFLLSYFNPSGNKDSDLAECLQAYNSLPGHPMLYEMFDSMPEVPNMVNRNGNTSEGSANQSHTDGGENVFVFYWNGTSDNVKDVDMLMYKKRGSVLGLDNGFDPKSGQVIDGPDADADGTAYATDNGTEDNVAYQWAGAAGPYQMARRSKFEAGEATTGGNGLTGHDETLEIANISFIGTETTMTATPGVAHPDLVAADQKPVIYRTMQTPTIASSSAPITIAANIWDDGSVVSATAYVGDGVSTVTYPMAHSTGDEWTAVIPGGTYPNHAHVQWYVETQDNTGNVVSQLSYADYQAAPGASANLASTGLRIDNDFAGDKLVINELMYDPSGGDNSTNPEFVEIYNNSNAALDIGGYYFQYGSNPEYAFPNGTTIDANDFLVVVYNKTLFLDKFPGFPNAKLVEHDPFSTASVMANSGTGTVYLRASDFATVLDTVAYRVTPPWPGNTISGSGYAAQNTGYSIELFNPNEDNSDGQNWFVSSKLGGTPGAHDFLLEGTRNLENPTPSDEVKLVARTGFVPPVAGSVKASYSIDNGATQTVTLQPDGNGYFSYSLGMLPDRTYVSYVIEAQSSADNVVYQASNDMLSFIVTSQAPFENNDIIITEIMYNPAGGDNGSAAADRSEWIEYYNRRSTATNIGGMLLGTERANLIKVPEGVMVAPYSYFLLVGNLTKFQQQYPSVTVPMIDAGWTVSKLANSGTSARLIVIPPNQVNIRQANVAIDGVVYQVNAGKWPADVSNSTIQLLDIALDNNAPESWTRPAGSGGTPGAQNTNSSGVADWSVY